MTAEERIKLYIHRHHDKALQRNYTWDYSVRRKDMNLGVSLIEKTTNKNSHKTCSICSSMFKGAESTFIVH
jgi:hypothetical protein